jgi:hypothetical protein
MNVRNVFSLSEDSLIANYSLIKIYKKQMKNNHQWMEAFLQTKSPKMGILPINKLSVLKSNVYKWTLASSDH